MNIAVKNKYKGKTLRDDDIWKSPRLYFALRSSQGTRKNLFEICRQFGYALSKRFMSSVLGFKCSNREK